MELTEFILSYLPVIISIGALYITYSKLTQEKMKTVEETTKTNTMIELNLLNIADKVNKIYEDLEKIQATTDSHTSRLYKVEQEIELVKVQLEELKHKKGEKQWMKH